MNSDHFRKVADEIDRNSESGFGGAFVIVPPADGGNPVATVILDTKSDGSTFWLMLKSKCDAEIRSLDDKQRSSQGFMRR